MFVFIYIYSFRTIDRSVAIVELSLIALAAASHAAHAPSRYSASGHAHTHTHSHTHSHAQAHELLLLLMLLMLVVHSKACGSIELLTRAASSAATAAADADAAATHAEGFILAGRPQLILHMRGGCSCRSGSSERRTDATAASWCLWSIVVVVITRRARTIDHATTAAIHSIATSTNTAWSTAEQSTGCASTASGSSRRALAQR